jgi:uncharacterized membrane protein YobD (UPF0266 family)
MDKLSWKTPEYIHTEKTSDWYWIVGIVTLTIAIVAIILNNLIFGILIIVSSATLTLYASRHPRVLQITLEKNGIHVGQTYHPYSEIESYWVETREFHPKIIVKSKKKLMFFIGILIMDTDPEKVDEYLSQYLPKIEHKEPLLEKLFFYLGF